MTALSIHNMNRTVGERELDAKAADSSNDCDVEYNLDFWMQQYNKATRRRNIKAMESAFHKIFEICWNNPAHIQKAFSVADAVSSELSPKRLVTLPAPKLNTLQALADAQEQSFNLRYYNNGGLPYFKHQKGDYPR